MGRNNTKMVSKFREFSRDLVVILNNLDKIDFGHLIPFFRTKYFEVPDNGKVSQALHFFKVHYWLFKHKFVFETLLEYWQKHRCFSEIVGYIGISEQ